MNPTFPLHPAHRTEAYRAHVSILQRTVAFKHLVALPTPLTPSSLNFPIIQYKYLGSPVPESLLTLSYLVGVQFRLVGALVDSTIRISTAQSFTL